MQAVKRVLGIIDAINIWTAKIISPMIAIVPLIILYEIFVRGVLNKPTVWVLELSQMIFGTYIILAGGYILYLDKHVSVDIFTSRLSARKRAILSVITSVFFFSYCGSLLYLGFDMAWPAFLGGYYSDTAWAPPIWPVLFMIPLGALLILLQGTAKLVRDLITAITGVSA